MRTLLWNAGVCILIIMTCIVPESDSYFSMLVLGISTLISGLCLYYLFVYYYNLPIHRQNILIFLTQLLIFVHGLCLLQGVTKAFLLQCFKYYMVKVAEEHIYLVCYFWRSTYAELPWFICIVEIMAFKTILIRAPVVFLTMNRIIVKTICILIPLIVHICTLIDFKTEIADIFHVRHLIYVLNIEFKTLPRSATIPAGLIFLIILFCIELYNHFLHDKIVVLSCACFYKSAQSNVLSQSSQVIETSGEEHTIPQLVIKDETLTVTQLKSEIFDPKRNLDSPNSINLRKTKQMNQIVKPEERVELKHRPNIFIVSEGIHAKQIASTVGNTNKEGNSSGFNDLMGSSKSNNKAEIKKTFRNASASPDGGVTSKQHISDINFLTMSPNLGEETCGIQMSSNSVILTVNELGKVQNTNFLLAASNDNVSIASSQDVVREKHPVSYRFVLLMAFLGSIVNIIINITRLVGDSYLTMWILSALLRFLIFNAPILWLLSHEHARQFMKHRLMRNTSAVHF